MRRLLLLLGQPSTQHLPSGAARMQRLAVWAAGLVLVTLCSCGRAAYVFSSHDSAYLGSERAAPSALPVVPLLVAPADSLPAPSRRVGKPAQARTPKVGLRQQVLPRTVSALVPRAIARKLPERLARLAAKRHISNQAGYPLGVSSSLRTGITCLVGGAVLLVLAASASADIVGVFLGALLALAGSILLVTGLVFLIIALANR